MKNKALEIVESYILTNIAGNVKPEDLFITWNCYILGNRKYLIGWGMSNHYFEVTYNKSTDEWYLDVYKKVDNKCI